MKTLRKWWKKYKQWCQMVDDRAQFLCSHGRPVCPICGGRFSHENYEAFEAFMVAYETGKNHVL